MGCYCPNIQCRNKKIHPSGSNCPECGTPVREFGFWASASLFGEKRRAQRARTARGLAPRAPVVAKPQVPSVAEPNSPQTVNVTPLRPPTVLPPSRPTRQNRQEIQRQNFLANLGLLEGESVRLSYKAERQTQAPPSIFHDFMFGTSSAPRLESRKGVLVFTNDNMIWMQQDAWSNDFDPALRIPLSEISGILAGGAFIPHIRVIVGTSGKDMHEFQLPGQDQHRAKTEIEVLLKEVREERRRAAKSSLSSGVAPETIFCKYCGARNRADQQNCSNCDAPL